jgi:hypothetical protein
MYKYKVEKNSYRIPTKVIPECRISYIVVIIYLNLVMITADYFYKGFLTDMSINDILLIFPLLLIGSFYTLYLAIDLIHSVILKKQYFEINYDGIIIKRLFRKITLKWNEIYSVEKHSIRAADSIRISLEKDLKINKYLRTLGTWFGLFYIDINNFKYKNINIEKFLNAVKIYIR